MRAIRITAAALVAAAVLVLAVLVAASAVPYRKPVDPYPDLPSQQYKTTWVQTSSGPSPVYNYLPGSPGYAEEQAAMKAYLEANGKPAPADVSAAKVTIVKSSKTVPVNIPGVVHTPGTAVNISSLPKALSGPAKFVRGAAGGPLGLAFMGGFALGEGGVALYGLFTGNDPLPGVCGSGLEGTAGFLYLGIMPDCPAPITAANSDIVAGLVPLTYNGTTFTVTGQVFAFSAWYSCGTGTPSIPPGYRFEVHGKPTGTTSPPSWRTHSQFGTDSTCQGAGKPGGRSIATYDITGLRIVNPTTLNVAAESGMQSADPNRTPTCKLKWDDGSTTTGTGTAYKETTGFPMSAPGLGCTSAWNAKPGAGTTFMPTEIGVESNDGVTTTEVMKQPIAPLDADEKAALNDRTGKGLVLWKGTENCLNYEAECDGWWEDPDKETNYRCTFGNAAVELNQCYVYAQTFDPEALTPTITDPVTGEQQSWTGTGDFNSTDPGTGPNPGEDCMGGWASAPNPIEWVLHPIKCALVWAFVPRTAAVNLAFADLEAVWEGKPPGQIAAAVASVDISTLTNDGCELPITFHGFTGGVNACEGMGAVLALFSRLASVAVIGVVVFIKVRQQIAAMVNYNVGQT